MEESNTGKIKKIHIQIQTYFVIVKNVTTKRSKNNILLTYHICTPAMIFESFILSVEYRINYITSLMSLSNQTLEKCFPSVRFKFL